MNKRGMGAILFVLPFSAAGIALSARPRAASANSAPPYWFGTDASGVILNGDTCPVEVESEHLTLQIGDFPNFSDPSSYRASMTAEYTFYNPTEETYDLSLVFPMGESPEYYFDSEIENPDLYSILTDGEPADYKIRYTIEEYYPSFDIDEGISKLYPAPDPFYKDDLPVYVHTFEIDVPYSSTSTHGGDWVQFALEFSCKPQNMRVFCSDNCAFSSTSKGDAKLLHGFENDPDEPYSLTVYAVGADIFSANGKVFRRYEDGKPVIEESATVREQETSVTTFGELVSSLRTDTEIPEEDWHNAFVEMLAAGRIQGTCMSSASAHEVANSRFLRWFEYHLTVPAGGRVVNRVTAPIYPTVDRSSKQTVYKYVYLLSPAQKWKDFGSIRIDIETPYYLSDSSLAFEKREGGYTFTKETLPMGELTFSLTEEERVYSSYPGFLNVSATDSTLTIAIVLLCVVAAAVVVAVTVIAVRTKRRKRRREEAERKLRMGRAEEGTIDLPSDPHEPVSNGSASPSGSSPNGSGGSLDSPSDGSSDEPKKE